MKEGNRINRLKKNYDSPKRACREAYKRKKNYARYSSRRKLK